MAHAFWTSPLALVFAFIAYLDERFIKRETTDAYFGDRIAYDLTFVNTAKSDGLVSATLTISNGGGRTRFWALVGESDEPSKMPLVAGDFLNPNPPSIPNDTKTLTFLVRKGEHWQVNYDPIDGVHPPIARCLCPRLRSANGGTNLSGW